MVKIHRLSSLFRNAAIFGCVLACSACSTTQKPLESIEEMDNRRAQLEAPARQDLSRTEYIRDGRRTSKSKKSASKPTGPVSHSLARTEVKSYEVKMPMIGSANSQFRGIAHGMGAGGGAGMIGGLGTKSGGVRDMLAESQSAAFNTEGYDHTQEASFTTVTAKPLSTFSIDVDTAAYSNMRRFVKRGQLPPADAVRIEEMINYFEYDYEQPEGSTPFSITTEFTDCPWNPGRKLAMIGLQGESVETEHLPPMNLVFLIDVSGSMQSHNKLPLVKSGLKLLVNQMRPEDRIALVVYAGAAGVVLPSTSGADKQTILGALERLRSGGSTAGAAGLKLAYQVARQSFMEEGNNRVILASDGDFNVGPSSQGELVRLIEQERKNDVFLSVLGFGMGNYKDNRMEKLANKGNGNYAYIDTILEAKKVLVTEMGGSLLTIAKDVKLQVEFNPQHVGAYRLIGYNNRRLANRDFNDDKKDAGELGSGHTVTAFYEIIPTDNAEAMAGILGVDSFRYQDVELSEAANESGELFTVKLRYKTPRGKKSKLIVQRAVFNEEIEPSDNLLFASSVVEFGLLLRDSKLKGTASYETLLARAQESIGEDEHGYRYEFIQLVKAAEMLK